MKPITVPLALPECGEEEIRAAAEVIRSGWLTTGAKTFEFERRFAEVVGARHCVAVNSATAALHLALEAVGVGPGDRVLVPVHTFTATAEVVRYLGADPLFVDCDRETFCIDAALIGSALQAAQSKSGPEKVKAILPVHFAGHPCPMDGIMDRSADLGVKVVEDAAHAFPAVYRGRGSKRAMDNGRTIGSIGDVTCFSFYANKTITTGEGGMLATDDDAVAKRARVMRLHGIDRDVWNRYAEPVSQWAYDVVAPGFKYNMPDLAAAIGLEQLKKASRFRQRRQAIAQAYLDQLKDIPGLVLPRPRCSMDDHSWHLFVVLLEEKDTRNGLSRDGFVAGLKERHIGAGVHYIPLHRMSYYRDTYHLTPEMFPNSEWVFHRCVSLPIFSAMTDDQLAYVIDEVKKILG
ncbi:MAG: DegT/DnrJ/EryC1/StrS family aminotransferase [Deltaproteobacteria bacterium]|nr:DegT/DnrJ/EryC1/StrS family aminotransferase [Deltaproteobacteria bacterium]